MKIIKEGNKTAKWLGKQIECSVCGQTVELEPGDAYHSNIALSHDNKHIQYFCSNCGTITKSEI